jgi:2-phosphosulfolactate phosphatase
LLAGERDGVRIRGHLTGGTDFDLGNSPRDFTPEKIANRRIVMTTTNGTRALRACAGAKVVWIGSFLNLSATARRVQDARQLLVICSGTGEQAAYEDALGAGALCDLLWARFENGNVADSARIAQRLYLAEKQDLAAALGKSSNGIRLASQPELAPDVPICAQRDLYDLAAKMGKDGVVRKEV